MNPLQYRDFLSQKLIKEFQDKYSEKIGVIPKVLVAGTMGGMYDLGVINLDALYKTVNSYCPWPYSLSDRVRKKEIVHLRYMYFHLAKCAGYTLSLIGDRAGGKDHTTVMHGLEQFYQLHDQNPVFRTQFYEIVDRLKQTHGSKLLQPTEKEELVS